MGIINRLRSPVHLQHLHLLRLPRVFDIDGSCFVYLRGPDPSELLDTSLRTSACNVLIFWAAADSQIVWGENSHTVPQTSVVVGGHRRW